MGIWDKSLKKEPFPVTRIWHGIDVGIGVYALKKEPSILNWIRLGFAVVGLAGNIVIAYNERRS